jgi:hypothetical protein
MRLDLLLSTPLLGLGRFPQMFRCAVREAVGRGRCFLVRTLLRFSHTPQVYDIAHAVLIHNSDFNSELRQKRAGAHAGQSDAKRLATVHAQKQNPAARSKSAGRSNQLCRDL